MNFDVPRGPELVAPPAAQPQPAPRHVAETGARPHPEPDLVAAATCPRCGGDRTIALAPGRYRCDGEVSWLEEEFVPDVGGHAAWGLQGVLRREVRRYAPCEHEFMVAVAARGPDLCTVGRSGAVCGAYAVGVCQEAGCARPACYKHAAYDLDQLVCTSCQRDRQRARDAWRKEAGAVTARAVEERSAGVAAAKIEQLRSTTAPAEILEMLREFHEDRKKRYVHAWSDPDRTQSFLSHVVPAWGRYLRVRTAEHAHELVRFDAYRVDRRGGSRGIVNREPCFVSTRLKQQKFFMGETVTVDDAWAYTADTAYHLGELAGLGDLGGRFSRGPVLSGPYVLCPSVQPVSVTRFGRQYVPDVFKVRSSRPLQPDDIIQLTLSGHRRVCAGHASSKTEMQLT